MLTNIMKGISIAALIAALFWRPSAGYQLLLQITVLAGAAFVIVQSYRVGKFVWGIVFFGVAILFTTMTLDAVSLVLFALSLVVLKTQPRLSIASITDRTPGSVSL